MAGDAERVQAALLSESIGKEQGMGSFKECRNTCIQRAS